jgi:predicted nuclease with TOPRIM domain
VNKSYVQTCKIKKINYLQSEEKNLKQRLKNTIARFFEEVKGLETLRFDLSDLKLDFEKITLDLSEIKQRFAELFLDFSEMFLCFSKLKQRFKKSCER